MKVHKTTIRPRDDVRDSELESILSRTSVAKLTVETPEGTIRIYDKTQGPLFDEDEI